MSSKLSNFRVIIMCAIGNALELYDFTLYGFFAVKIGQEFFGSHDSLSAGMALISIGFFARPIGAILFGYLGDVYGRRTSMLISIIGMGFAIVLVGITPSYKEIGVLASIIILISRFIQGLCIGGEYTGSAIFCLETIGPKNRGFYSAWLPSGAILGILLAKTLAVYFDNTGTEFGWRIPFILGFFISIFGIWFRSITTETDEFKSQISFSKPVDFFEIVKKYKIPCIKNFCLAFLVSTTSYELIYFLPSYIDHYGSLEKSNLYYINFIGICCFMICSPISGAIYDFWGEKKYMLFMVIYMCIFPYIAFRYGASPHLTDLIISQVLLGISAGLIIGVSHIISQNLFPTLLRYRAISLTHNLGVGLGGGSVALISLYLIKKPGCIYMPGIYISVIAIFVYILFAITRNRKIIV